LILLLLKKNCQLLDFKTPPRLKVFITPTNLWDMKAKTTFILFIDVERVCKKNWTNDIVDKMDAKYPFKEKYLYFNLINFIYPLIFKIA